MVCSVIECVSVGFITEHGVKRIFHGKNIGIVLSANLRKTPIMQNKFTNYTLYFYCSMWFI